MTGPSCGAPMRLETDKEYLVCDYCGNMHFSDQTSDGYSVSLRR